MRGVVTDGYAMLFSTSDPHDERHEESLTFCIYFQAECQRALPNAANNFPLLVKYNTKMSQGSHQKPSWYLSAPRDTDLYLNTGNENVPLPTFFIFITEVACKMVLVTITI